MATWWLDALSETDRKAAEQLGTVSSSPGALMKGAAQDVMPTAEADDTARKWLMQQIHCPNVVIMPGCSQVTLIEPLLQLKENLTILLLEQDPQRLATALDAIDSPFLADAIRSHRLCIDPGGVKADSINRFIDAVDFSRVPRIRLLDAMPVPDDAWQMAVEMTKESRELIRLQSCDLSTRLRFGADWQEQAVRNLPLMVRHARVSSLFDQCKGLPALVIGAGPSLNDAIAAIFENRRHFVVICVGRAISFLRRHSMGMHLVVTGDGQQLVKSHFQAKLPGVPVVASLFSATDVVGELDRVFFMDMESMNLPRWIASKIGELGEVYPGGNVTTAAMSLAVKIGCNPVLTAGLDFSYPEDGQTHAEGPKGEAQAPGVKYYDVPGNYQTWVKTNRQMRHYIDFTRDLVRNHAAVRFINVNTAGAKIEGMELIRPEALKDYRHPELLGGPVTIRMAAIYEAQTGGATRMAECRAALAADLPLLQSLRMECVEAAMLCNRLMMLMRRPGSAVEPESELRRLLAKLEPLDRRLKQDPIMDLLDARLESVAHGLSERMLAEDERAQSPAIRINRRWRTFYQGVADACEKTESVLKEVMATMEPLAGMVNTATATA